jgi:magnesium-transporting ATPase (P-type)
MPNGLLDAASDLIEKELTLVGATAVEDKLQIGVGVFFKKLFWTKYWEISIFLV